MHGILRQVGRVASQQRGFVMQSVALQNPVHMCPPSAIVWRVRITFVVAELMMDAMRGYPEDRSTFERERGANRHGIFQPLRHLITAMRQQPVVAHADAYVDGE